MTVVRQKGWCKAVLWSPMQNATSSHEMPDYPSAGYDSPPILSFNAWSSTNKYPMLGHILKYICCLPLHWTKLSMIVLACVHFHFCVCIVSALCLCSQHYYIITCNQRWKWLFSNQESTKPPRDMQGLALCTWVSTCVHVSWLAYQNEHVDLSTRKWITVCRYICTSVQYGMYVYMYVQIYCRVGNFVEERPDSLKEFLWLLFWGTNAWCYGLHPYQLMATPHIRTE